MTGMELLGLILSINDGITDEKLAHIAAEHNAIFIPADFNSPLLRQQNDWLQEHGIEPLWAWNGWWFDDDKAAVMFKLRFG